MYRKPGRGRVLLLVFVALSIIVITIDYRAGSGGILRTAKEWSVAVVAPIQRGITTVFRPVGNFFASIGELGDLREENRRLKEANEQLESENTQADEVFEENVRLADLTELEEAWPTMDNVMARVIAPDPGNYREGVYIDKGRADGVKPNMPVLSAEGLVGKTLRVTEHETLVVLVVDPDFGASARVKETRDTGGVQGNGTADPLSMLYVGKNSDVEVGDEVTTSGQDPIYPPAIPIGEVIRADVQGGQVSKTIDVEPYVDPAKLDYVMVLMPDGNSKAKPVAGED
ncbi:MAG: rod shape-determining protein MreC [Actinomycetota bacterium]|nr:rod shape-determining protein MreC [Actinomycetota bacterium]